MARLGLHFRIKDGKREGYLREHEDVPEELEQAYRDAGAGFRKESVFEDDGHVFAYIEVDDPETLMEFMAESDVVAEWNDRMSEYLYEADLEDPMMEEIYRMD